MAKPGEGRVAGAARGWESSPSLPPFTITQITHSRLPPSSQHAVTLLFISDLHLEAARPEITGALQSLLRNQAREAEALYILGDLFDAWIGDDDDAPLAREVAEELHALSNTGTRIYFQHGNRDFLLSEEYAQRCGMQLLPEEYLVQHEGESILLMHGDSLCTDDVAYQRFRLQSRDPAWQSAMLAQPLAARRALAAQARASSAAHTSTTSMAIMDVNENAVAVAMAAHGVTRLIHGHTHRPATHAYADGRERFVLAAWHDRGSALRFYKRERTALVVPF